MEFANVLIDGPGLHVGTEQTADHAYVRFHGRNYDIWYKRETEDDHRLDRYDCFYKREQLESWVPRIKEAELKAAKVRVYFNNHARSKSVRNPFLLMYILLIGHKSKEIHLQDQFTLGESNLIGMVPLLRFSEIWLVPGWLRALLY